MMSGYDPPLFAGSTLGLRAWVVQARLPSSAIRLGATITHPTWEAGGEWTQARCVPVGGRARRHRAPHHNCSCGLYAWHPRMENVEMLWEEHVAGGARDLADPCFVEIQGPIGLVEAAGRVEVHRDGFRAERARPVALVAGRHWPEAPREAIAELAGLYEAEVLEADGPEDVLDWCHERGGVLADSQLDELLAEREALAAERSASTPGPVIAAPPSPAPAPSVPPATRDPLWSRALSKAGELLLMGVLGIFVVLWYGMWAVVAVSFAGAILFGWFEEEPVPVPAKIVSVKVDRERCEISAVVKSKRRLRRLNVIVSGHLRNGDSLGKHNFKVGPIAKGRSRVVVVRPDPALCRSRHHFTTRVRPVWKEVVGRRVEVESLYRGPPVEKPQRPAAGDKASPRPL